MNVAEKPIYNAPAPPNAYLWILWPPSSKLANHGGDFGCAAVLYEDPTKILILEAIHQNKMSVQGLDLNAVLYRPIFPAVYYHGSAKDRGLVKSRQCKSAGIDHRQLFSRLLSPPGTSFRFQNLKILWATCPSSVKSWPWWVILQRETSSWCKSIPTNMILYVIRYSSCDGREGLSRLARKLGGGPRNWSIPPGNHTVFWWSFKPTLVYFAVNLCSETLKTDHWFLLPWRADLLQLILVFISHVRTGIRTRKILESYATQSCERTKERSLLWTWSQPNSTRIYNTENAEKVKKLKLCCYPLMSVSDCMYSTVHTVPTAMRTVRNSIEGTYLNSAEPVSICKTFCNSYFSM